MRTYLFSDESGDLTFHRRSGASRYFAVGTLHIDEIELAKLRAGLASTRDRLAWSGRGLNSSFHASTDSQEIRDAVFTFLSKLDFRIDVTLLEKAKGHPSVRSTPHEFFRYAWLYHVKYLAPTLFSAGDEVLIVSATLGTKKDRADFQSSVNSALTDAIDYRVKRKVAFWRDESDFALQAVDYCTWAVTRKFERGDTRAYDSIKHRIRSEFDLWRLGTTEYY